MFFLRMAARTVRIDMRTTLVQGAGEPAGREGAADGQLLLGYLQGGTNDLAEEFPRSKLAGAGRLDQSLYGMLR